MKIKGWTKFQHFKDRCPPWVKLYRDLLDSPDWFELSDKDARLLVHLWLLASEDKGLQGELPSIRAIAFRLRTTEAEINKGIRRLSTWLIQDDNNMISSRYQHDAPETETETETEIETETDDSCTPQKNSGEQPAEKIIEIPLIKRDGVFWVTKKYYDDLVSTYPALDVMQSLREIRRWNLDNPKNRKTRSGIKKHVASWLGREQNKAPRIKNGRKNFNAGCGSSRGYKEASGKDWRS